MSALIKIKELAASVRENLAALTINPSQLENLDAVASERSVLQEKINLLEEAEAVERERLLSEKAIQQKNKRRLYLLGVGIKTEKLVENYDALTDQAKNLIVALVKTLAERENVFNTESTDIDNPIRHELISKDEFKTLYKNMEHSSTGLYPGSFFGAWREAINEHVSSNHVHRILNQLINQGNNYSEAFTGARTVLADEARAMSERELITEPVEEKQREIAPSPVGQRYEVNMYDNSTVVDLNDKGVRT